MSQPEETIYGRCQATAKSTGEQCGRAAIGEHGKCDIHGGKGGAPPENQNATTHAMRADPANYHNDQSTDDKVWIEEMTEVICDRLRARRGDIDPLDRYAARTIAIKMHMAATATDYVKDELVQTVRTQTEFGMTERDEPNALMTELRLYHREVFNELKKLGVVDDPESQKADALAEMASERYEIID